MKTNRWGIAVAGVLLQVTLGASKDFLPWLNRPNAPLLYPLCRRGSR